jgi:hypothetical protein
LIGAHARVPFEKNVDKPALAMFRVEYPVSTARI